MDLDDAAPPLLGFEGDPSPASVGRDREQKGVMMNANHTGPAAMARITDAEVFEIETAFARPYSLSKKYGTLTSVRAVLLKLTDCGSAWKRDPVSGVIGVE